MPRVKPEALEGVLGRLEEFVGPFAASLEHAAQRDHLQEYVTGLVSNVKRKNIESIAYLHEQDRQPLQKFIGQKSWEWRPMIGELARQIGAALGESDGVLVFDPSGVLRRSGTITVCPTRRSTHHCENSPGRSARSTASKNACGGGKKTAPCLSVPELRWILGHLLHEELQSNTLKHLCDCATRLNRRKEQARFFHWKKRNRLAPRKKQRQT